MLASPKRIVKRMIDRGLGRYGWRLARTTTPPLDLRGETDDPIAAIYLAKQRPFVMEVPLARCRGLGMVSFPLGPDTVHPWVRTLQTYSSGSCTKFEGSPLAQYYEHFQPKSAASVLGLEDSLPFAELPPLAAFAPWTTWDPSSYMEHVRWFVEIDNREHATDLTADHGWQFFGPVSPEKGALEVRRLISVYRSIQQNGYCRSDGWDGDITATVLADGESWACLIRPGQHRIAALAALGRAQVPVRLMDPVSDLIVRRAEVESWPQVRSGVYTRRQALAVFDRILTGRPPVGAVPPEWERAALLA